MKLFVLKLSIVLFASIGFSFLLPPDKKHATFQAIKMLSYSDEILISSGFTGIATLFEAPPNEFLNPYKGTQDGIVKLNSKSLFYNPTINMYLDSTNREGLDSVNWKLNNSVNFTNISYTTVKPIPTFTNIGCIPTILRKSNDYILTFGNIPNVDKIEFTIDNGQLFTNMPFYRVVPANINCLTIPKNHLTCLNINNPTYVKVSFINQEEVYFGNKKFIFENILRVTKQVTIVN